MDSPAVKTDSAHRKSGGNTALVVGLVVVAVIGLGLGAMALIRAGGLERVTPIGDIKTNIRELDGQAVTIKGTVSAPLNIFGVAKAFRLTDDSGDIMVVTEKGLPADGDEVRVDGYVKQAFKVGTLEQTIVYEPAEGATADKETDSR